MIHEYKDKLHTEKDRSGYTIIPTDDYLESNEFDAPAQLKLRKLLASSQAA